MLGNANNDLKSLNIEYKLLNFEVSHFEISGNNDNDLQQSSIDFNDFTLEISHSEISEIDFNNGN